MPSPQYDDAIFIASYAAAYGIKNPVGQPRDHVRWDLPARVIACFFKEVWYTFMKKNCRFDMLWVSVTDNLDTGEYIRHLLLFAFV